MIEKYTDLIGKYIIQIIDKKDYIYFRTKDNITIKIYKFEPYCCCNVGEYIDSISKEGACFGTITNIEVDIKEDGFDKEEEGDFVYKGTATFYFENGKLDMKVHGEDNGFYGVSFTLPIEVFK